MSFASILVYRDAASEGSAALINACFAKMQEQEEPDVDGQANATETESQKDVKTEG